MFKPTTHQGQSVFQLLPEKLMLQDRVPPVKGPLGPPWSEDTCLDRSQEPPRQAICGRLRSVPSVGLSILREKDSEF